MQAYFTLTLTILRLYLRDPLTVALSLALIVFMMVLFGVVMGEEPFEIELPLAVVDLADSPASRALVQHLGRDPWLLPLPVNDEAEAMELIRRAPVIGTVVRAEGFDLRPAADGSLAGLRVIRDEESTKWIDLGLDRLRDLLRETAGLEGTVLWQTEVRQVAVVKNRYIDFIFPGILAMAIMQTCLASGIVLLEARERGVLRRLQLTPLSSATILGSFLSGRFLVVALHLVVLVLVATFGFEAQILAAPWELAVVVLLGTLAFMALGLALILLSPTLESASLIVQTLSLPMSFLCGVFFEVRAMPSVLKWIAQALPLTYLVDMIRGTVTLGVPLFAFLPQILVLAAWFLVSAVVCLLAYRRWNREAIH